MIAVDAKNLDWKWFVFRVGRIEARSGVEVGREWGRTGVGRRSGDELIYPSDSVFVPIERGRRGERWGQGGANNVPCESSKLGRFHERLGG